MLENNLSLQNGFKWYISGSHLGPHRSQPSASVDLPKIGACVSVSGANLHFKDSLMRTFGATWK